MNDDGKLAALKTATKSLLTQLKGAVSVDGDVYVSIVPFVKDVNLGATNYTSIWDNWLDWSTTVPSNTTPSSSVGPGSSCPYSTGWGGNGYNCVTQPGGTTTTSTIPSSGSNKGYICPSNSIGCYDSVGTTTTTTHTVSSGWGASCNGYSNCSCTGSGSSKVCTQTVTTTTYTHTWFVDASKWGGCVTDRGGNAGPVSDYDRLVTAPSSSIAASMFPAEQYSSCPKAIMGLSSNWTGMTSLVDSMTASGGTNQPIGLVWAWQTLAGGGPFTVPAKDSAYTYNEVIILLSDGLNTQDRWYGNGSSTQHLGRSPHGRHQRQRHLRQHQGRRRHHLYDPGQHRRRPDLHAAAELRQQHDWDHRPLLPADLGGSAGHHLPDDRHQPDQAAGGPDSRRARRDFFALVVSFRHHLYAIFTKCAYKVMRTVGQEIAPTTF